MLDERGCRSVVDIGHRRGLGINLRVTPWRGFEILPCKRMDIRIDIVGHPVADACTIRDGLEPIGVGSKESRDIAALAPAHAAHTIFIDKALIDEIIYPGHYIPGITYAEIFYIQGSERFSITC